MPTLATYSYWEWEDAFSKFGFNDGDGWNGTYLVSDFIDTLGYQTSCDNWGIHNYLITDIRKDGKSILFKEDANGSLDAWLPHLAHIKEPLGYAEPSSYLPKEMLDELWDHFDENYEVVVE